MDRDVQLLLRELAPRVLSSLVRRYRDLGACEDAVQEALLAGSQQWPLAGLPDDPRAWLTSVAIRKVVDHVRAETARRLRESIVVSLVPPEEQLALAADEALAVARDDTLDLFFMCCHPSLTSASAIALTLRAVGGLTTAEIARAFLVPEPTMAQRLSRARQTIKTSGIPFEAPGPAEYTSRLGSVMHVLYLIFSEGYVASSGAELRRVDLSMEALRLARLLRRLIPQEPEVTGLLSLMLLTDARRDARTGPAGELIPLDQQDRSRWNRAEIDEGTQLITETFARGVVGAYQLQAAIAALHDSASSTETTDWPEILSLYSVLLRMNDNPMVALSHAIALAMVQGPAAGLERLDELAKDSRLAGQHRLEAARGHLLERAGDRSGAITCFERAARRTASTAERDYLMLQAARLREA
ncbi:MAG: sigma factor-like helix-turn-helix DNA-binding protein [Archangium sp.]|nr:sigma factor-like helix-turn-helix DNA-binding protein [Archangium sp.]MDP3569250.1 sigma factor-like helix-turn-helix DNA-binding protein [Archangium sp.]